MARRGKDNDHMKSGQLHRRGQYQIQNETMMMNKTVFEIWSLKPLLKHLFRRKLIFDKNKAHKSVKL